MKVALLISIVDDTLGCVCLQYIADDAVKRILGWCASTSEQRHMNDRECFMMNGSRLSQALLRCLEQILRLHNSRKQIPGHCVGSVQTVPKVIAGIINHIII